MTKTRIVGVIRDALGEPVNGVLKVSLASTLPDSTLTNNTLLVPSTEDYQLMEGVVDIELYESETYDVSYTLQAFKILDSETFYDGLVYEETPSWDITTVIPRSVLPVSINDLQQTGLRISDSNSSLISVRSELERSASFKDLIGRIFRDRGIYDEEEIYRFNDYVYYPDHGRQYRYIATSPDSGKLPTDTLYWATFGGDKGDTGEGITGSSVPYNFATSGANWDGLQEAASKDALQDAIEQLETKVHATATFAPKISPSFTGNPTAPTAATSDNSTTIATTAFVKTVALSTSFNFTPVQQGGTVNFLDNKVYLGWATGSKLKAQVDNNLLGNIAFEPWVSTNFYTKSQVDSTFAPITNPNFLGIVTHPSPLTADNSTRSATTAYVKAQNYQANLGFTPLQQGGGAGQLTNKTYIGWSGSKLKAQVDQTDLGALALETWVDSNYYTRSYINANYFNVSSSLGLFAPITNPTLAGNVNIPTYNLNDSSTLAASTNHVKQVIENHTVSGFGTKSLGGAGYQRMPGGMYLQYGSVVITTDINGYAVVTVQTQFPNNFFTVAVSNGDIDIVPERALSARVANVAQFVVRVSPAIATAYRVNYIAIGN